MIVFKVIFAILVVGFHVVFPIAHIIKSSIDTSSGKKKWDFGDFFKNLFIAAAPWLLIALCFVLFFVFNMLFDNLLIASMLTVILGLVVTHFIKNL